MAVGHALGAGDVLLLSLDHAKAALLKRWHTKEVYGVVRLPSLNIHTMVLQTRARVQGKCRCKDDMPCEQGGYWHVLVNY